MRTQTIRTVTARISSAGAVTSGGDISAVRTSAGAYTVTLRSDLRALGIQAFADNAGGAIVAHGTLAGNTANIVMRVMNTATPTDCATIVSFQVAA